MECHGSTHDLRQQCSVVLAAQTRSAASVERKCGEVPVVEFLRAPGLEAGAGCQASVAEARAKMATDGL